VVPVLSPPLSLAARPGPAAAAVAARRFSPRPRPVLVTVLGDVRRPVRLAVGRIAVAVGAVAAAPVAVVESAGPEPDRVADRVGRRGHAMAGGTATAWLARILRGVMRMLC